jgi:hypothetical protein
MFPQQTPVCGKIRSSLCSLLHCTVTPSILGQIFSSATNSQTPSLYVPSSMSCGQVSHSHKTTAIIIFMYILNFKFLDSTLEDKRFWNEW